MAVEYKANDQADGATEEFVEPKAFTIGANIDFFIELVQSIKGHKVEFRWVISPPNATRKTEVGLFRTIDEFLLDRSGKLTPDPEGSTQCRVTRFMPSKD